MSPDEIKTFRERREWSQQELGEKLGVDQATVSRIERGAPVARPVLKLLERLIAEQSPSKPPEDARLAS